MWAEGHSFAVHCMAHKLNLVLAESCTVNRDIKTSLNVIDKLYSVFAEPRNHCRFLMIQKTLALKPKENTLGLQIQMCLCCQITVCCITRCLKEMEEEGEKWSVEASGLYHHMTSLHIITSIIILEEVHRVVHVTHKRLKSLFSVRLRPIKCKVFVPLPLCVNLNQA